MSIKEEIHGLTDEMLTNLGRLVAIDSQLGTPSEGKPFGEGPAKGLEEALKIADELGFKTVNLDNYCGYAEMGEGEEIVGIAGHLDIVPVGGDWTYDPFKLTREGDHVYGRGTTDDKGPVLEALYAMKLLRDSGAKLNKRVRLIMGCNEETGSKCMEHYNEVAEEVSCGFTPDANFPCIHGEKGMVMMTAYSKNTRIISMNGGFVSNAVCDTCNTVVPAEAGLKEKLEAEGAKVEAHPYLPYAFYLSDYDYLEGVVDICEKSGVHTKFIPDYSSLIPSRPYTEDLMGLPVINIRYVPLTNTGNMMIKRAMDIVGSLFGIIITSPIMLLSAILVKCSSPGPVIFKQERVGLHNKSFYMYKFRSMAMQTAAEEKKGWTVRNDPRVTGIGKILRRTSIDELPQLFNILKGDMSLVGPRPERPQFVEKFKEEIPRYMVKHQVRPGLTGWAQVNGLRGDSSIKKRIEYDIYYIENWTLGWDFKILFLTFFKGFINKNAY